MEESLEVSKELEVKIEIKEGKIFLIGDYEGKLGGAKLELSVSTDKLIDAVTNKTENTIDDKLGELLKSALKKA
jgi:hypothetical protein